MNDDRREYDEDMDKDATSINDFSNNTEFYEEPYRNTEYSHNYYDNTEDMKNFVRAEVKKAKPKNLWIKFVAVALVFSLLGSGVTGVVMSNLSGGNTENGSGITSNVINVKDEANVENAVAQKAIPSVVGVTTSTAINNGLPSYFNQESYTQGVGSGVIITKDGYILTNSHVVSDGEADEIKVVFSDGEEIEAKLIWLDSTLDLAVIKVEKSNLTPIELGNSDEVAVGDKAIAIGNPLGLDLQSTLTSGVISGLNRTITVANNNLGTAGTSMSGLMQTDASINSGNSGGALLNSKGQLIGINTAKASQGEGIGFAIPINTAKSILDKIIETGTFESVTLGVQGVDLETYETYFKVDTGAKEGAALMMVDEKSPADKAGLKQGDVITKIDGKEVSDMNRLRTSLVGYSFGDKATITIVRNGKEMEVEVTFEKYETSQSSKNEEEQNSQEDRQQPQIINPFGDN
ncbi:trypsin-like peptidase domain-containing protein [Peptostreptococcaceae bacterium OttesenSCG-928-C18]|nr:trypsin-like peptidase domain-containing protein [Peptostreptococcaceae bacterium OttesenSCG-928-C18]